MSERTTPETPEVLIRLHWIVCFSAVVPGLAAFICVGWTYLLQFDNIRYFSENSQCPGVHSWLPPISYSIGVWEPQRFIWISAIFIHFPPRLLFIVLYRYSSFEVRTISKTHATMVRFYMFCLCSEPFGLVLITVVGVRDSFSIHIIAYAIWLVSFNFNMILNTTFQYMLGVGKHKKVFASKIFMILTGGVLSAASGCCYTLFFLLCNPVAYISFSIAEFSMVAYNPIFYCIAGFEYAHHRFVFGIRDIPPMSTKIEPVATEIVQKKLQLTTVE